MSRTLAVGLVLFSGLGGASCQPPNARIGEAVQREVRVAQARQREVEQRLAAEAEVRQLEVQRFQARLAAQGVAVRPVWTDEQLQQWVFRQYGNAAGARQRLDSLLAMQIVDIDRACRLTDAQKKKLQLAGRGDIKRFFDRYEEVKQKSQQNLQEFQQDVNRLQMTLQAGLFHEDSLLIKSLRNTLTGEQFARYDAMARERRASRHRANIQQAVAILQRGVRLRDAQRRELITLMTNETKPSRQPGPYDSFVLLFQLGRLPEEKLKRLFDQSQLEIVNQQLAQFQLEPMLRQAGQLPAEDDGDDSTDERPAPVKK